MLQLGDKVKFLNEEGGGIIKRFINKNIVAVEVEDGFEIPVPINQLIVLSSENKPEEEQINTPSIEITRKKIEGSSGVFLAFVPDAVFPANFDILLINNSNYTVLYSICFRERATDKGLAAGLINEISNVKIVSLSKKDLENWSDIHVQLLFHKQGNFNPISCVVKSFALKSSQFAALQNLKKTPLLDVNAYFSTIADTNEIKPFSKEMLDTTSNTKVLKDKLYSPKTVRERTDRSFRINSKNGYAEIDLHIEELLDNYAGLSNAQIVEIQLKHCRKAIENAVISGSRKLTIIHGVGNGTLKKEVRNLLKGYDGFSFYDAPSEKYGYGATEVLLKS